MSNKNKYYKMKLKYIYTKKFIGGFLDTSTNINNINDSILIQIGKTKENLIDKINNIKKIFADDLVGSNILLLEYNNVIDSLIRVPFDKNNYNKKQEYFDKIYSNYNNLKIAVINSKNNLVKPHTLLSINKNENELIECIAIKDETVINKNSPGYLGNIGKVDKKIILNNECKEIFDINNNSWCYFFVSLQGELIKQIKEKMDTSSSLESIIKQILGLRYNWGPYKYVVVLTVKAKDLFRPCISNSVSTSICDNIINIKEETEYKKWYLNWLNQSHKLNIPFTGLGYTYDTSKKLPDVYGVSEYIIKPHSEITIKHIYTLDEYINHIKS